MNRGRCRDTSTLWVHPLLSLLGTHDVGPRPSSSPCFPMTHLVRVLSHVRAGGCGVAKRASTSCEAKELAPVYGVGRWEHQKAPRG